MKTESSVCPKCGSKHSLCYGDSELVDENMGYEYRCDVCGFEGKEWYSLEFAGHWDMDGNEIEEQGNER